MHKRTSYKDEYNRMEPKERTCIKLLCMQLSSLKFSYLKLCNVRTKDSLVRETHESEHTCLKNMQNRLDETHTSNPSGYGTKTQHFAWEWVHLLMKPSKPSRRNAQCKSDRKRQTNRTFAWEWVHFMMKPSKPSRRNAHRKKRHFCLRASPLYDET